MSTLFLLSIILAIGMTLIPVAYWGEKVFGDRALGAPLLAIFASAALLGMEHYIALPAPLLFAVGAALAGYGMWLLKSRHVAIPGFMPAIAIVLFFAYPLLWRWAFPSIYPASERVTNLFFITHFTSSEPLPAVDRWFPPYTFDFYYPLQYYWAGLFVRALKILPGYAYSIGVVLLMGASGYLVWHVARTQIAGFWKACLITAAVVVGGSGAAPYIGWKVLTNPELDYGTATFRAITNDARFNGAGGAQLSGIESPAKPLELALEPFSYQFYLGDFHPTLIGLLIAFAMLAVMFRYEAPDVPARQQQRLAFAIGALTAISIAGNTWIFPLVALTAILWALWKALTSTPVQLAPIPLFGSVIVGGSAALAVLLPVLQGLAARQLETPLRWVPPDLHSPFMPWLLQWSPVLYLSVLAMLVQPRRSLGFFLGLNALLLLAFSELFYVNDLSINEYERTNSTLKWWGWIWSASLFGVGTALLADRRAWVGQLTALLLIPCLISGYWYARQWLSHSSDDAGRLDGSRVYTRDAAQRELIDYLRAAPDGIALESIEGNAYTDTGMISLLGDKPLFMGWPDHEYTWRGGLLAVATRVDDIGKLYARKLPEPQEWLRFRGVHYVLWLSRDCKKHGDGAAWELDAQLKPAYRFHIAGWTGQCPIGVWVQREQP